MFRDSEIKHSSSTDVWRRGLQHADKIFTSLGVQNRAILDVKSVDFSLLGANTADVPSQFSAGGTERAGMLQNDIRQPPGTGAATVAAGRTSSRWAPETVAISDVNDRWISVLGTLIIDGSPCTVTHLIAIRICLLSSVPIGMLR